MVDWVLQSLRLIIAFGFRMIVRIIKGLSLRHPPKPSADNAKRGLDNSRYYAQPYPMIFNSLLILIFVKWSIVRWTCQELYNQMDAIN